LAKAVGGCKATAQIFGAADVRQKTITGGDMQKLEFSSDELDLLREMLQHALSEIDVEVFRTDTHDFKTMLKGRRELMEQILAKLSAVPAVR
jgi:hypothetical protein